MTEGECSRGALRLPGRRADFIQSTTAAAWLDGSLRIQHGRSRLHQTTSFYEHTAQAPEHSYGLFPQEIFTSHLYCLMHVIRPELTPTGAFLSRTSFIELLLPLGLLSWYREEVTVQVPEVMLRGNE